MNNNMIASTLHIMTWVFLILLLGTNFVSLSLRIIRENYRSKLHLSINLMVHNGLTLLLIGCLVWFINLPNVFYKGELRYININNILIYGLVICLFETLVLIGFSTGSMDSFDSDIPLHFKSQTLLLLIVSIVTCSCIYFYSELVPYAIQTLKEWHWIPGFFIMLAIVYCQSYDLFYKGTHTKEHSCNSEITPIE